MDDLASIWLDGTAHELGWWRGWMQGRKPKPDLKARLNPRAPFDPEVEALIRAPANSTINVLDVGAGPITSLGYVSQKYTINLTPIDALADEYRKLLTVHQVKVPVRSFQCHAEDIGKRFGGATFDVVHAQNSLDHCLDPYRVILAMCAALKPKGLLYIATHPDEGQSGNYAGLHQWNFQVRDDRFYLWRPGVRYDVSQALWQYGRPVIDTVGLAAESMLRVTMIKQ